LRNCSRCLDAPLPCGYNDKHICIQYEAFIGGEWRAIVRYDTAHGWPHRDLIRPDGAEDKQTFSGYSREEVLASGERDIKTNWKRYRTAYEQEMER
jgi:hypothetical protein